MENNTESSAVPKVVEWMHEQLVVAHFDLAEYKKIFTSVQEDLDVLNSTGSLFFARLHRLYWSSFIQNAGRLMDPAVSMGRDNISLARLVQDAKALPFHESITALKAEADGHWEPLKKIRNRVIAHSDFELVVTVPSEVHKAETESIERIYAMAGECIKLYYRHFENVGVGYDHIWHHGGATQMLSYLKRGRDAWELERRERIARQP
jgi:hypothetical protein